MIKILILLLLSTCSLFADQESTNANNLYSLWHMNDNQGTVILDNEGKLTGSLTGGVWVEGKPGMGKGIKFTGTNGDGIITSGTSITGTSARTFCVSCVIDILNDGFIAGQGNWDTTNFTIRTAATDKFTLSLIGVSSINGTTPVVLGRRYFVCSSIDSTKNAELWVNGNLEGSVSASGWAGAGGDVYIARRSFDGSGVIRGTIDEVSYYNRQLTSREISQKYYQWRGKRNVFPN